MSGTFQHYLQKYEKNQETKVKIRKLLVDFCKKREIYR